MLSGFYCCMETSKTIRVGICIYVIRDAAISQGHVPVCITRKMTRAENQLHRFGVDIEIDLVGWVVEIDLISVWGIGINLISV